MVILRFEVKRGGFRIHDDVTDEALVEAIGQHTSTEQRAMMNGGLSRQIFRKARGKLDETLSLEASPEEMCTLELKHITDAMALIAPLPKHQQSKAKGLEL